MTTTKAQTGAPVLNLAAGSVTGQPRLILRLEGVVLLVAALGAFTTTDQSWWLVPAVLFLPDLFMAGYVQSTRLGALTYNLAHSYPLPALIGAVALVQESQGGVAVALVWFAHIGMDRALGYGLKQDHGFAHTHLGTIGHDRGGDRLASSMSTHQSAS